jgi:hypothetical protein
MSSRDPAGTPAKSLSSVTVCGGFARFLSAHVLAALGTSRSWLMLHGARFSRTTCEVQIIPVQTLIKGLRQGLAQLQSISGLGMKKLEAYGEQVLPVCKGI